MASGIPVKGGELGKPDRHLLLPSANDKRDSTEEILGISDCELDTDGEEGWEAQLNRYAVVGGVFPLCILPRSRHRDGSIYRGTDGWKQEFCIADRSESK